MPNVVDFSALHCLSLLIPYSNSMKIILHFFVFCFLSDSYCFSQNTFCVDIGGQTWSWGNSVIQTTDGGYAIAGMTSLGMGNTDMYVEKLDGNGFLIWSRTIGGTNQEDCRSIIQTQDGGYAIAGTTGIGNADDFYIVKLDGAGTLQWTKTVGGTGEDRAYSIIQTSDGSHIIVGIYDNVTNYAPWGDIYAVKLDGSGNLLWTKTLGGNYHDLGFSVKQTNDGGFVIAGGSKSYGASADEDVYIIKLDSNWTLQWTKTIGDMTYWYDEGRSVIQTADGGYAITGITCAYGAGNCDVYAIKLDSIGSIQWKRSIGGIERDEGYSIVQANDGGYVIAGNTESFGNTTVPYTRNIYLVKLNSSGNLQWTKTAGGTDNDATNSVIKTTDGGFAITGYKDLSNSGPSNPYMYLMKLDSLGNGCCVSPGGGTVSSGGSVGSGGVVTNINSIVGSYGVIGSGGSSTVECSNGCVTPTAFAGSDNTICNGTNITLNGVGGTSYSWIPSTGLSNDTIANPIATPSANTTYSLIVTNACGIDTGAVTIYVIPVVSPVITGNDTICLGQSTTLTANGGTIYLWNTGGTSSSIIVNPTSNTTYSVNVSNGICNNDTSITVEVNLPPFIGINGNTNICQNDTTTLYAIGSGSYLWSNGSTSSSITISATSNTTFTLTITDINGCIASDSILVIATPIPIATISPNTTICSGEFIFLNAGGGSTYLWNTGSITSSIQVTPNTTTNYSVIVSNGSCSDTAYTSVTVNAVPQASITTSISTITYGQVATLSAGGGVNYIWSTGETTTAVAVAPTITTIYCVTTSDSNNCSDSACVTLYFYDACASGIYLPNAFSPNNDLENDFLHVFSENTVCVTSLHIIIYNRIGEKVFESTNPYFKWDGSYQSKLLNTQVLTYVLVAELINKKTISKKGNINLIR